MRIYKISFLFRTPSVGWDYKSANNRDLADDIAKAVEEVLAPTRPVRNRKSSVQHNFYIATNTGAEQHKSLIGKVLEKLIPDEAIRKQIIVSVTEPDGEEMDKLRQTVNVEDNVDFWNAVQTSVSTAKKSPVIKKPPMPLSKAADKAAEKIETSSVVAVEEPARQTQEPISLSEYSKKIQAMKTELLKEVKGQRHAVDTVVQGIFQSQMFSALDPRRNGPLATFLFTGPSGVGKTMLAGQLAERLGIEPLYVDMSEYSDNLANNKFNGEHGQPAVVTGYVRKHPRGLIIFDEVEKAHINAIHQFLQILDGGRMMDHQIGKEVSFKDTIIIMTTNAGKSLYDDATVCDLSNVSRKVILDGLRKDVNPQTREPFFPECITTRMANGHVILFNHLEPYALLQIIRKELEKQAGLFAQSTGIKINYDPVALSALVLYNGGGVADARTLRGLARSILTREVQEIVMQLLELNPGRVDSLKEITLTIDTQATEEVKSLFSSKDRMQVAVLTDDSSVNYEALSRDVQADFTVFSNPEEFKRRIRGVTDYILLDPLCGNRETDHIPNDVEDLDSNGIQMFEYVREFMPEIPVYILDTSGKIRSFDTLLGRGARGVIRTEGVSDGELRESFEELTFGALVNNVTFTIGRANKFLSFNCAQYMIEDSCAVVAFEKLQLKGAIQAGDGGLVAQKGENNNMGFDDVIGCKGAKEALMDYRDMLQDPRKTALKGKKMPKGVLLYGPPGTGKTMLAKAMANECKAAFFPTSAAGFFGPLVGQTEQNIQDLFKKARKYAPAIIFIDEVDAIGRMRTGSAGSTHNEDALNIFLSEMDGFVNDEKRPVFVLAATNYQIEGEGGRVLDPAFVRRFDRKILIPLPDTDDRYQLLAKSLKKHGIHFGADHEKILKNMAARTGGMNNADLEMINANYARILGDGEPNSQAYMDSLDAYRFGDVNKMDPAHLRQTACHEAGHALICRLCGVTPSFLTVVSRGGYGGYMESAGENKGTYTYQELMDRVCRCLAGRVAEIEVYGDTEGTNTGASSDIRQARYFMKISLNEYAMGEKLYARWTQEEIEQQMKLQYQRTRQMIQDHRDVLDALTDRLVQQKSMDQLQLEEFFTSMKV